MSHFSIRFFIIGAICAALAAGTPAANAQVLDPAAYTSDGALSLASGAYTLDTDALTFNGYSGVLSNGIAVFDFSSINVGANATVNVIGSHPLALLSQSDALIGGSFNLSGGGGGYGTQQLVAQGIPSYGTPGAAGSGGYSGGNGGGFSSPNIQFGPSPGNGPGGGQGGSFGNGGGFGGGGLGYAYTTYGPTYGNLLTKLEGGSGGSGGRDGYVNGMDYGGGGGGGGGGAIEINALGFVTLAGGINVSGGYGGMGDYNGGGGAGGGVLLAGNRVVLSATGQINANGGAGFQGSGATGSGGGGGGRITIQTIVPNGFSTSGALNVKGGFGSFGYYFNPTTGGDGVITVNGRVTNTPAPGSLLVAVLGAVPVVAALRRRRK